MRTKSTADLTLQNVFLLGLFRQNWARHWDLKQLSRSRGSRSLTRGFSAESTDPLLPGKGF